MLGFYVHTHWGYNNPYAARSWTLDNWQQYLGGLSALGYDTVQIWPLLDSMPLRLTQSDHLFLERIGRVIDMAHTEFGMKTIICCNSNVIGNERAETYSFESRPYFACEAKLNPGDSDHMKVLKEHLRNAFEHLHKTDMITIIDSDPGGWIDSPNSEFVDLLAMKIRTVREFNPQIELYYWMHVGWENYNRFWKDAKTWDDPYSHPRIDYTLDTFVETLDLMKKRVDEPWGIYVNHVNHYIASEQTGLQEKRVRIPYGLVEGEPTFPLTNWNPQRMDQVINDAIPAHVDPQVPRGHMGNAQTHCLQLPHTYLFAHLAQGRAIEKANLADFAGDLLPEVAALVSDAWSLLEANAPEAQLALTPDLLAAAHNEQETGKYGGLLFGDPARFLIDLAMNLKVRARLGEFKSSVDRHANVVFAMRNLLDELRPYQERLGFVDAYGGPLYSDLNEQIVKLEDPQLNAVCSEFVNWANPSLRNGALVRLLDAMQNYCLVNS